MQVQQHVLPEIYKVENIEEKDGKFGVKMDQQPSKEEVKPISVERHKQIECKLCKQYPSRIKYQSHTQFYCTTEPADDIEEPKKRYLQSYLIKKNSLEYMNPEKVKAFFEFMK